MRSLILIAALLGVSLPAVASQGEYLARVGDCTACHTSADGAFMAGGVAFDTPLGKIYSTNITPDKENGIGAYTFEDFDRAMRQGIGREGQALYPAMPYTSYARLTEVDMRGLYDYFMKEVQPQPVANRDNDIPWPLSMRWPLRIWQWLFHDTDEYVANTDKSAAYNRGAYLVQGLGHCGACHTPRGWAMQELAMDEGDERYLAGAELDGWYASDLRSLNIEAAELQSLMRTGRSKDFSVSGPMADVISHSSQYFTQEDLTGLAEYLLANSRVPKSARASAPPTEPDPQAQRLYASYCSVCHGNEGQGVDYVVPALVGNPTVISDNPSSLLQVLLKGSHSPRTLEHMGYAMPGYGWTLDDGQLAGLANYLRSQWGNQATRVNAGEVASLRSTQRAH
ncbi:c-type cytochrome [Pseudomonas sp. TTU2014-080ASC]|uniref:c-type cytochrome n=1 Tax=Pseudomonas sp. TTU2014-080ASC TaxID=1729724 RepID=UPI0009EAE907|nr:cytochrome c [Pseudomonas sp. TTU2014-080ASC]